MDFEEKFWFIIDNIVSLVTMICLFLIFGIFCPILIASYSGIHLLDAWLIWYIIGLYSSNIWTGKFFDQMSPKDWKHFCIECPIIALTGPLAAILSFPI